MICDARITALHDGCMTAETRATAWVHCHSAVDGVTAEYIELRMVTTTASCFHRTVSVSAAHFDRMRAFAAQ